MGESRDVLICLRIAIKTTKNFRRTRKIKEIELMLALFQLLVWNPKISAVILR